MPKYSEYTEETSAANDDLVLIKDVSTGETNRVQLQNILPAGSVGTADLANAAVTAAKLAMVGTSYSNGGSAGGTFYYTTIGTIKIFWGRTASISVSGSGFQSTTRTITFPTSFFSTIQMVNLTPDAPTNSQYLSAGVSSSSASTMDVNINQSNGTNGAAALNVLVIGT